MLIAGMTKYNIATMPIKILGEIFFQRSEPFCQCTKIMQSAIIEPLTFEHRIIISSKKHGLPFCSPLLSSDTRKSETTSGTNCELKASTTPLIASMVSIVGICLDSGTLSTLILCLNRHLKAIKIALDIKVPKKTNHSISNQRKVPAISKLLKSIGFGYKCNVFETFSTRNTCKSMPMNELSCLIPSA